MKTLMKALFALTLIFSLAGCGEGEADNDDDAGEVMEEGEMDDNGVEVEEDE